jgi:hypothetical protein
MLERRYLPAEETHEILVISDELMMILVQPVCVVAAAL